MTITPKQVANLIFAVSQLRYFENELMTDKHNHELIDITVRWQFKVDEVLSEMGVDGFIDRKQLLEIINLENKTENA